MLRSIPRSKIGVNMFSDLGHILAFQPLRSGVGSAAMLKTGCDPCRRNSSRRQTSPGNGTRENPIAALPAESIRLASYHS